MASGRTSQGRAAGARLGSFGAFPAHFYRLETSLLPNNIQSAQN
jgi:hypothetical protein